MKMRNFAGLMIASALFVSASSCGGKGGSTGIGGAVGSFGSAGRDIQGPGGNPDRQPDRGESRAGNAGSCDIWMLKEHTLHLCMEAKGSSFKAEEVKKYCTEMEGRNNYQTGDCMSQNRVGRCVLAEGSSEEQVFHYYEGFQGQDLAASCTNENGGKWIPN